MSKTTRTAADLSHIAAPLRAMATPIGRLHADDANVRAHDERNLAAIAASLAKFGQQAPVVCEKRGRRRVVIKGNGMLAAARSLGWKHLAAVDSDLAGADARAYAIADNRTGDLSAFDERLLAAQLQELEAMDFDLDAVGYTADELDDVRRAADRMAAEAMKLQTDTEDLGVGPDADRGVQVVDHSIHRPPSQTWVLVGIPTVRFAEVHDALEQLATVRDAVVKVKVQDERE